MPASAAWDSNRSLSCTSEKKSENVVKEFRAIGVLLYVGFRKREPPKKKWKKITTDWKIWEKKE